MQARTAGIPGQPADRSDRCNRIAQAGLEERQDADMA